jgi:hypothetical protein
MLISVAACDLQERWGRININFKEYIKLQTLHEHFIKFGEIFNGDRGSSVIEVTSIFGSGVTLKVRSDSLQCVLGPLCLMLKCPERETRHLHLAPRSRWSTPGYVPS